MVSRRSFAAVLAAAISFACMTSTRAQSGPPPRRIVALDWTAASMLASLGIRPVGVADVDLYRVWVGEPVLAEGIPDVGLRDTPNLEIVAGLKPDFILVSPLGAAARPILEGIAPTREISIYGDGSNPLDRAAWELRSLGQLLGRREQAETVIAGSEARFSVLRSRLGAVPRPKLLVVQFLDARFVRIYGPSSLFGSALTRLGLANAWTKPTNPWGFALAGIEKLAAYPDADIVVVDPLPSDVTLAPDPRSLWGNLPAVRQGRIRRLPAAWAFGEITAAERFASLLVDALGDPNALRSGNARF